MNIEIDKLMDYLEEHMMKTVEHMQVNFSTVRTGKASPSLVDAIVVDYYGTPTKLKELAGITAPEPRLLVVQPWDPSSVALIEKALIASNLGVSPVSDGRVLRLPIPELSEERRLQLAKQVKSTAEDSKIAVRNIRREGNDVAKKAKKNAEITEDDLKVMQDDIQKLTDNYIKEIDEVLSAKEDELMNI